MKNFTLSFISFFVFCVHAFALSSEELLIIEAPQKNFSYSHKVTSCQFADRDKLDQSSMNLIESFYLKPSQLKKSATTIEFSLGTMMNIRFFFSLKENEGQCQLERQVKLNDIAYEFVSLKLTFDELWWLKSISQLSFQVIDQEGSEQTITFRRFDLEEFISLYELSLGVALNTGTNFRYKDTKRFKRNNPTIEPIPAFMVRYGPFFVNNDGAGLVLLPFKQFFLLGTFLLEGEPYHGESLRERKRSIYAGPLLKSGPWEIHYYTDLLGRSNGEVLKVTYDAKFKVFRGMNLSLRPFVQYWDRAYNDYYFGTDPSEGMPVSIPSGYNYGSSVQLLIKKGQWQFIHSLTYKKFSRPVSNSPVTTRSYDWRLITGFSYQIF